MTCVDGDELEPPWSRFPWIPMGSIGWRMGSGEGYQMSWGDYVERTIPDLAQAFAYLRRHPRAPRTWISWIARWLAELANDAVDYDDDDAPNPWHARVEDEQLVGDDVAYPVWVRNWLRDGGIAAPWVRPRGSDDPQLALRHNARELGW
ncbi:MAG: hypothetical protein H0V17_24610, partial [Deltaproteobacteria bacterium]|nr:hypothetical protein [Deltaproteobacteria bacterium]